MSHRFEDNPRRRPPPVQIPPIPRGLPAAQAAYPPRVSSRPQQHVQQHVQQIEDRNASSSTQQARSATTPLTSPLDCDASRLPIPKSGSHRSRDTAIDALAALIEESREKPDSSAQGSTNARSTTRSKYSERSHNSAMSARAQNEVHEDARTSRARIEARSEANLFKMTGQVPPTPILKAAGEHDIVIARQDLREQCRAASAERKIERQPEIIKSPKKRLFGMNLPSFGRSTNNTPVPPMPSKAAQVLGEEPRNPTPVVIIPIEPSGYISTPTKAPRSSTAKSLPTKLLDQNTYRRSHHNKSARRDRTASRKSPRVNRRSADGEAIPLVPKVKESFESAAPPTPPAKDTPPEQRATVRATSPLRRAAPGTDRLRENYEANDDDGTLIPFPAFNFSPSSYQDVDAENAGLDPIKHLPYSAGEYQKLIAGEPLPWASASEVDWPLEHEKSPLSFSPLGGNVAGPMQMPDKRWSEEEYHEEQSDAHISPFGDGGSTSENTSHEELRNRDNAQNSRNSQYNLLPPRFYSPSNRSVAMFADGETPSKNSDTKRLLCTVASPAALFHFRHNSHNGSIEMVFQGSPNDIDPRSSTGHLINRNHDSQMLIQTRDDTGLAARVMQELRMDDRDEMTPHENSSAGHLQPDQSSSRLTDMLHGVSPRRDNSSGDFRANCPSAVPSPLHNGSGGRGPMQPMAQVFGSPAGSSEPPKPIKLTLDQHFLMTNEHVDVLGKSVWDHYERLRTEVHNHANNRHASLVATIEKHVKDLKMQVDTVSEKADRATEQNHNINTKLEELFDFIKGDVIGALHIQETKMVGLELNVKELQMTLQNTNKLLEQRLSEPKANHQQAPAAASPTPLPNDHSRTSFAGYYGNTAESGREGQPAVPQMPDHRNSGHAQPAHNDSRAGYSNYGQWGPRGGYPAHGSKEERTYTATNPYLYANGTANGGQYGNGYNGGYSYN